MIVERGVLSWWASNAIRSKGRAVPRDALREAEWREALEEDLGGRAADTNANL